MKSNVVFSSSSDEWTTPKELFESLNNEFIFTLDPCSTEENHLCERYYTKEQDGLSKKWGGAVFCNPPYSQIAKWVKKAYEEALQGTTVVLLVPARTDTRWFHEYIYNKHEIRFIKGRLHFSGSKQAAPFPSMVVIMKGEQNV